MSNISIPSIASTLKSIIESRKDNNFSIVITDEDANRHGFTFEYTEETFVPCRRAIKACVKYIDALKPSVNRFKKFQMFNILERPKYCFLFEANGIKFLVSLDATMNGKKAMVDVWNIDGTEYEKLVNW